MDGFVPGSLREKVPLPLLIAGAFTSDLGAIVL